MSFHNHDDDYTSIWFTDSLLKRIVVLEQKMEALCKHQNVTLEKTEYIVKDETSHE